MSKDLIKVSNVRIAFSSLFEPTAFKRKKDDDIKDTNQVLKYRANFVILKSDEENLKIVNDAIENAQFELKSPLPADKLCISDGDSKEYEAYANAYVLRSASHWPPKIYNCDKTLLKDTGILYDGCFVNAIVRIRLQKTDYGKRVTCDLYGVQYLDDGVPLITGDGAVENLLDFKPFSHKNNISSKEENDEDEDDDI